MPEIVPAWQDSPSTATPVDAANLNLGSAAIRGIDSRLTPLEIGNGIGDGWQRLAVPSYFYPTWFNTANIPWYHTRPPVTAWERMQAAVPAVEICVINPGTGAINSDYVTQVSLARASGLTILGYVDTGFTAVTLSTAQTGVNNLYTWYGVDGIFFDQASPNPADIAYYTSLYTGIKAKPGRGLVVLNPGTVTDESYMAVCDIVCNVETDPAGYRTRPITDWEVKYPARRFWHIIYAITDNATRDEMLQLSRNYRAGYIYLTGDTLPNPYDTLPPDPFWQPLLAALTCPHGLYGNRVTTTSGRPAASSAGAGAMVYDSTLGKPIWSNGTVWKDAAGTTV